MRGITVVVILALVASTLAQINIPIHSHKTHTKKGFMQLVNLPLNGSIDQFGEFFAQVTIGTPAQTFELQLDTGSTDLLVYAKGCAGCGRDTKYDMTKSSTAKYVQCNAPAFQCDQSNCWTNGACAFDDQYGDGSEVKGWVATDVMTMAGLKTSTASFGGIESSNTNFEPTGVDGIFGLAYKTISSWSGSSMLDNLIKDNNLYNSFAMCLLPSGGVMNIGTDFSSNSLFQWTPIVLKQWYVVSASDMAVNGKSLGLASSVYNENQGPIVDSGTTLMIVSSKVMKAMETSFKALCSSRNLKGVCNTQSNNNLFNGNCFTMSSSDIALFPSVSITLKGISSPLTITGADYLFEGSNVPGAYCLGIQGGSGLPIILGDIFMQRFNVVFDRSKGQVGFGPISSCPGQTQM